MLIVGFVEFSIFPLTYLAFKIGLPVEVSYAISISIYCILMVLRVYLIKDEINMTYREYTKEVFFRISMVTVASLVAPTSIYIVMEPSISRLVILLLVSIICTGLSVLLLGLTSNEKRRILSVVFNYIKQKRIKV